MKRKFLMLAVVSLLTFFSSNSFAWDHYGYAYHGGRWHTRGWFGFDVVVNCPPVGVVIADLPFGYARIVYGGIPYYYYGNTYFTACPGGYIVVPAPQPQEDAAAAEAPVAVESADTVTAKAVKNSDLIVVNIPKKEGGFIPVKLTKHGNGYIGPQGEFYAGHPTVAQLSVLYGE